MALIYVLLILLVASLALYVRERLDVAREDALWEARRLRLARLNKPVLVPVSDYDPDLFEWAPGAMWIVEDPLDVQVEYTRAYQNMRGIIRSGAAVG